MDKSLASILAVIMVFFNLFGMIFDFPRLPYGNEIDLENYVMVFEDDFDGTELDTSVWGGHYTYGNTTSVRRGGYWNRDLASVKDGNLHITTKYLESGVNPGDNAGWYSYGMDTNNGRYEQLYGYFEVRCVLPKGCGLWSAFWMLADGMFDETEGGANGAEIDVFESPYWFRDSKLEKNCVSSTVHIDGYEDAHEMESQGEFYVDGDPYSEFNTYGVEWTQDEYIFYINGVETARTSFGVSHTPQYMILSVEVGGDNGTIAEGWAGDAIDKNEGGNSFETDFIIDYVRAYSVVE